MHLICIGTILFFAFFSFGISSDTLKFVIPPPNCTLIFVSLKSESLISDTLNPDHARILLNPRVILKFSNSYHSDHSINSEAIRNATTKFSKWRRPIPIRSQSNCHYVIIPISITFEPSTHEELFHSLLNIPNKLFPGVHKNTDKFLILTDNSNVESISKSKAIQSIKYKIICTRILSSSDEQASFKCHHHCLHCPQPIIYLDSTKAYHSPDELFPDFHKNFYKSILKLSTTDKVPQLLEMYKDPETKQIIPLRGLYASVLGHIEIGLNFTGQLLISSGGGSTGHQLSNGTWAGIIGDIETGRADIGFMAAVTMTRYQIADICAPINYAYIGFVTGPPQRVYTWKAIFWPFDEFLWIGTLLSIAIAVLGTKLLMHEAFQSLSEQQRIWKISTAFEMYCRSFLDQGDDRVSTASTNFSLRLFIVFWMLAVVVLSTAYRSKMVSFMTFPVLSKVPQDFEQLAKDSKFKIDFHYFGNVGFVLFTTSKAPSFVAIAKKMNLEPDPLKCLERSAKTKSACIIFIITFEELKHRNFSDQRGHSPLKFQPYTGFMFPAGIVNDHKSKLQGSFYTLLSSSMEMGLMQFWEKEDLQKTLRNKNAFERKINHKWIDQVPDWDDDAQDVLQLKNLKGALAVFLTGTILSLIAGCKEFFSFKSRKRARGKLFGFPKQANIIIDEVEFTNKRSNDKISSRLELRTRIK